MDIDDNINMTLGMFDVNPYARRSLMFNFLSLNVSDFRGLHRFDAPAARRHGKLKTIIFASHRRSRSLLCIFSLHMCLRVLRDALVSQVEYMI